MSLQVMPSGVPAAETDSVGATQSRDYPAEKNSNAFQKELDKVASTSKQETKANQKIEQFNQLELCGQRLRLEKHIQTVSSTPNKEHKRNQILDLDIADEEELAMLINRMLASIEQLFDLIADLETDQQLSEEVSELVVGVLEDMLIQLEQFTVFTRENLISDEIPLVHEQTSFDMPRAGKEQTVKEGQVVLDFSQKLESPEPVNIESLQLVNTSKKGSQSTNSVAPQLRTITELLPAIETEMAKLEQVVTDGKVVEQLIKVSPHIAKLMQSIDKQLQVVTASLNVESDFSTQVFEGEEAFVPVKKDNIDVEPEMSENGKGDTHSEPKLKIEKQAVHLQKSQQTNTKSTEFIVSGDGQYLRPITSKIEQLAMAHSFKPTETQVLNQIVEKAQLLVTDKHSTMEIQLKPEHLGKVNLKVSIEQGVVKAEFTVESQQVRQLIESNLTNLRHSLANIGVKVDQVAVSLANGDLGSRRESQEQPVVKRKIDKTKIKMLDEVLEEAIETQEYGAELFDSSSVDYKI